MTETKHTPGPWTAYNSDHGKIFKRWRINAGTFHPIATIAERKDSGEEQANARLIASAPELLEALRDELHALRLWNTASHLESDIRQGMAISIDKIERVIAKAEKGGQS